MDFSTNPSLLEKLKSAKSSDAAASGGIGRAFGLDRCDRPDNVGFQLVNFPLIFTAGESRWTRTSIEEFDHGSD